MLVLQQVQPGTRLREPEWAERLGVNRMALREAFARLEAEGLIVPGPSTGYFVPTLTREDVEEVTWLRTVLELAAIDRLCARPTDEPADLAPLAEACDAFDAFLRQAYVLGVIEADRRFHESLVDAAGSKRLSRVYHRAPLSVIRGNSNTPAVWAEQCKGTSAEHRAILAALHNRDAAAARRLLQHHLTPLAG